MQINLVFKPFSFKLLRPIQTSKGILKKKKGWLLRLQNNSGKLGWGEISPLSELEFRKCEKILGHFENYYSRKSLEDNLSLKLWPGSLRFGIGAALAEMDDLISENSFQEWLKVSSSAILLPNDESLLLQTIDSNLKDHQKFKQNLTFKWKVTTKSNKKELALLKRILSKLPPNAKLRIDANGGWSRNQANEWANHLHGENRLEWLEQPLEVHDLNGLHKLAKKIPVALDESLLHDSSLRKTWGGWQIRRPLIEGDPRQLLKELAKNNSFKAISTSFETGIGRRWVEHIAALQQISNTPTQPGLAPNWCSNSQLFSNKPQVVWEATT